LNPRDRITVLESSGAASARAAEAGTGAAGGGGEESGLWGTLGALMVDDPEGVLRGLATEAAHAPLEQVLMQVGGRKKGGGQECMLEAGRDVQGRVYMAEAGEGGCRKQDVYVPCLEHGLYLFKVGIGEACGWPGQEWDGEERGKGHRQRRGVQAVVGSNPAMTVN
jgi:hypothetical protein